MTENIVRYNHRPTTRETIEVVFLPQLDKVKKIGTDKWMACCPAHSDRSPSFKFVLADDGRILLHCFAGCPPQDICEALHIKETDLFPDEGHYLPVPPHKRSDEPTEDAFYLALCKAKIRDGKRLTDAERQRYAQAAQREATRG